jgi:hypothetical protein
LVTFNIAALLSLFFQPLYHSLCFIILLALSYVPIYTPNFFSIISSYIYSPRTPFPVTYVNPRALLIAVALFVSSACGLRPKGLAVIRTTVRYWRPVLVTVEVALLQIVQSCCISTSGCRDVPVGTPLHCSQFQCSPLLPRLCSDPPNKFWYSIGQGAVPFWRPEI